MATLHALLSRAAALLILTLALACGGGGGGGGGGTPAPVRPAFTAHPQGLTVNLGGTATLSVAVTGTPTPSLQWRRNGLNIPGATATAYTIASAQVADAGTYDVYASNAAGSDTSNPATVFVNQPPTQPVISGGTSSAIGKHAYTYALSATDPEGDAFTYAQVPANPDVVINGSTLEFRPSPSSPASVTFNVVATDLKGAASPAGTRTVSVAPNRAPVFTSGASVTLSGATQAFPAAFQYAAQASDPDGDGVAFSLAGPPTAVDDSGAAVAGVSVNVQPSTGLTAILGSVPAGRTTVTVTFIVRATDVLPGTYSGDSADRTVTATYTYVPPTAPVITSQPQSLTVNAGAPASFSVTAIGTPPLAYQWRKGGVPIPGATASTFTIPATTVADSGSYQVGVSNVAGSVTSNIATLTVNPVLSPPVITQHPLSQTVTVGQPVSFSVAATGATPLSYQWRRNGVPIPGATAAIYAIASAVLADAGGYDVVVTNPDGSATSNLAVLTVNPAGSTLDLTIDGFTITQASQAYDRSVPLVRGRQGFLRVFVKANQANSATPQVRVRIYNGALLVNTYTIPAQGSSVPTTISQGSLTASWNLLLTASDIQAGYNLLADVDPSNTISESDEGNNQYPLNGTPISMGVVAVQPYRTTIIPVTQSGLTGNVNAGNLGAWTDRLWRMYPIETLDAALGAGYTTSAVLQSAGGGWSQLLSEIETKRVADGNGASRYYFGAVATNYASGVAGLGYVPGSSGSTSGRSAIGWDKTGYSDGGNYPEVYAHEVGHNFGRLHAPCGGPSGVDPSFPYPDGSIGVYGYDIPYAALKDPATYKDIMGYCTPNWVSDYTVKAVLAWRQSDAVHAAPPRGEDAAGGLPECLVVWGRVEHGAWVLEPAFSARLQPPAVEAGDATLEAFDAEGRSLFSRAFALAAVACGAAEPGDGQFTLALSLAPDVRARIARLEVSRGGLVRAVRTPSPLARLAPARPVSASLRPGGTEVAWDDGAFPLAVIRDPGTGAVLAFARGGLVTLPRTHAELEVQLSDGIQGATQRIKP